MAKPKPPADPLLTALNLALDSLPELLPLMRTKGKGLFAKVEAAEHAIEAGYFTRREVTTPPVGRKKGSTVVYGIITEAGARKLAEGAGEGDLTPLLESLNVSVRKLADGPATPPIQAAPDETARKVLGDVTATVGKALSELRQLIEALPGKVEQVVAKALPSSNGAPTATDPAPVLSAIGATLARLKVEPKVIKVPVPSEPSPPSAPSHPQPPKHDTVTTVADEIVAFVAEVARERSVGCDFVELFDHLRTRHPALTIGSFHDALRALNEAGRVRLRDWPRMLDEMPRPELALFISSTVMYHVQPAH